MKRRLSLILFLTTVAVLVLALAFTIYGSTADSDLIMNIGIIAWLATSALIFVWLILLVSTRLTRYGRGKG